MHDNRPPTEHARNAALLATLGALTMGSPAWAAGVQLKLELPRLNVAEYHKPYVAVWLDKPGQPSAAAQLAVWYDLKKPNNGGAKWLRDMRQWWRQGGRSLALPADGISGATRAPGEQSISLDRHPSLSILAAGHYEMVVEVAREGGGREVQRIPFSWPVKSAQQLTAQGEHELGKLQLNLAP